MASHLDDFNVHSPNYSEKDGISLALYNYQSTKVVGINVYPSEEKFVFKTDRKVPKIGVMLVGWGGFEKGPGWTFSPPMMSGNNALLGDGGWGRLFKCPTTKMNDSVHGVFDETRYKHTQSARVARGQRETQTLNVHLRSGRVAQHTHGLLFAGGCI